jgi:hypothetical protein
VDYDPWAGITWPDDAEDQTKGSPRKGP